MRLGASSGPAGQQLGNQAFPRPEVGDVDRRCEAQREVTDRLPGTPRAVVPPQPAGDEIEVLLLRAPPLLQDAVEVIAILGQQRQIGDGIERRAREGLRARRQARPDGIEGVLPLAPVGNQVDRAQERELGGDARLPHAEDLLQLRDREFLAREQGEQAEARRVRQRLQDVPGFVHAAVTVEAAPAEGNGGDGLSRPQARWRPAPTRP